MNHFVAIVNDQQLAADDRRLYSGDTVTFVGNHLGWGSYYFKLCWSLAIRDASQSDQNLLSLCCSACSQSSCQTSIAD